MEKIYSKSNPGILLHIIYRCDEVEERTNVAPDDAFLQLATMKLQKGKTFQAHKHLYKEVEPKTIAQESWIIVKGKVKAILYDLDDTIITEKILSQGDCSITFRGGHNYLILEDDTIVYEYKSGPYLGQEKDKEFIK
jgi:hypothetical protein